MFTKKKQLKLTKLSYAYIYILSYSNSLVFQNRKAVVSPVIDSIDENTFKYSPTTAKIFGAFDWEMNFKWVRRPEEDIKSYYSAADPFE